MYVIYIWNCINRKAVLGKGLSAVCEASWYEASKCSLWKAFIFAEEQLWQFGTDVCIYIYIYYMYMCIYIYSTLYIYIYIHTYIPFLELGMMKRVLRLNHQCPCRQFDPPWGWLWVSPFSQWTRGPSQVLDSRLALYTLGKLAPDERHFSVKLFFSRFQSA